MGTRLRSVAVGAAAALALALPATLVAQILDATADDGIGDVPLLALSALVMAGAAVGGWVVARRDVRPRAPLAAAAGLIAMSLVQGLGVARRLVADEDVDWGVVPGVLLLGSAVAAFAAIVSRRRPLP
jgi:hypothetical protein